MDVREGDNLYLWNKVKVSNALMERLPYLESVQIRRHLPDTLVVTCHGMRSGKWRFHRALDTFI